ncbi:hypothetical protein [Scleromatobacter humisilvae]|uniref:Uncharacterized protein n=1 Tax=Scleromatobacter humisilvae TaxID=2897159 RepID=A0A9X2C406_9BURK|nr:hypothetical protein [Scleromatobacter humisilvae]MCK9689134.1 hypothetical protein [Scleromatobacter humisilvae]
MRGRVAAIVLIGGIAGAALALWHPDTQDSASGTAAVAPEDARIEPPRNAARETAPPPPPSTASAVAMAVPSSTPRRSLDSRALVAAPLPVAQQPPRQALPTLVDATPAPPDAPRPTEALQAVPPQPLPPVSRVPLLPSAVSAGASR